MPRSRITAVCVAAAMAALTAAPASAEGLPRAGHGDSTQIAQAGPGARRALVRNVQEELARLGYDPGAADGRMGGMTQRAIRAYQKDAGLRMDGRPSNALLDQLKAAERPASQQQRSTTQRGGQQPPEQEPRAGAPRNLALDIQRELQVRGYYAGALDGAAGPGTRAAIRAFQRDAGFPVTGDLDERLLAELRVVDAAIRAGRRN